MGHCEQMSQVIRFVDVDHLKKEVSVKEAFLVYIQIHATDAETPQRDIVGLLEKMSEDRNESPETGGGRGSCFTTS